MHEIFLLPHTALLFMHGLAVPSLCRLSSVFLGTGHRGRTGTVGSWELPRADSQTHPYRNRKPALNTWFYLIHREGEREQVSIKVLSNTEKINVHRQPWANICYSVFHFPKTFLVLAQQNEDQRICIRRVIDALSVWVFFLFFLFLCCHRAWWEM